MNKNFIKKRLRSCTITSKVIARFPFVRCVILNGSLAAGTAKESSDIDILIVAKSRRIFTTRFFIISIASILGIKRSKEDGSDHSGKFCFNYFLTEDFLKIPTGRGEEIDRYCADNYSKSMFMAGNMELFKRFIEENGTLFSKYNFKARTPNDNSKDANKGFLQTLLELILGGRFGDWFERSVKNYQIKKIEKDSRTTRYPELIVYNDKELRFHPPSQKLRRTSPPKASLSV